MLMKMICLRTLCRGGRQSMKGSVSSTVWERNRHIVYGRSLGMFCVFSRAPYLAAQRVTKVMCVGKLIVDVSWLFVKAGKDSAPSEVTSFLRNKKFYFEGESYGYPGKIIPLIV